MPRPIKDFRIFALACVLLGGTGQGVVAPKLPELLKHSSELALDSGFSAAFMYLGILLSTFKYGSLADRGRVHWLLAPGLLAYAATLLLLGCVDRPSAIFAVRFIEGLSLSAIFVAADFALGRLSAPGERGRWLSYYGVALSIGLLLGPALAFGLTHSSAGRTALVPLSVVAALALIAAWLALGRRIPPSEALTGARPQLDSGALVTGAAYGAMEAALVAVFPVIAVTELKVAPELCLGALIIVAALSSLGWGELCDRWGARSVALALLLGLFLGPLSLLGLSGSLSNTQLAFTTSALFGCLAGGLYPTGFAWLLSKAPESQYGYASGSFARAYGAGSLIGPLLAGVACQAYGARGVWGGLSLVGGVGLTLAMRSSRAGLKQPGFSPRAN